MTPTPTQIESFKKGLELGLVPSGWGNYCGMCMTDNPKPLPEHIEAMEGLAGRVLIDNLHNIKWHSKWYLYCNEVFDCTLPGTHDDTLTPLVEAVGRLGNE